MMSLLIVALRRFGSNRNSRNMTMMKMTNLADYAVVSMSHIAARPDKVYSAAEIAEVTGIPGPTVSKILGAMARAELLVSHRGLNGGFSLARPAAEISIADIISVVDGPIALTNCIEHAPGGCLMETCCGMRPHWQKINDAVRGALENIPLSEVLVPLPDFITNPLTVAATPPVGGSRQTEQEMMEAAHGNH